MRQHLFQHRGRSTATRADGTRCPRVEILNSYVVYPRAYQAYTAIRALRYQEIKERVVGQGAYVLHLVPPGTPIIANGKEFDL